MSSRAQRVGVLGAGQLALMLAQAAQPLGVEVICAGAAGDCAGRVAPLVEVDLEDRVAVQAFADTVDVVTIESENISANVLGGLPLFPNARAIGIAQERLAEKRFFHECGIDTAPFAPIDKLEDFTAAFAITGLPAILKTRRLGYDGKGQVRLTSVADAEAAWSEVGGAPSILEGVVPFTSEVSLLASRNRHGDTVYYPLIQNFHRDGILRTSLVPCNAPEVPGLQARAETYVARLLERLDYIGTLAVEFFLAGHRLIANEMAPRVHNSGHWTIEGAQTSQFSNHLRAILDMPLGSTASRPMAMLNCIGTMPPAHETESFRQLSRHDYGKQPRAGRKVGHLTFPRDAVADIEFWRHRLEESC